MTSRRVGVAVVAVFSVFTAACASSTESGPDASVPIPDRVIEAAAVESPSVLMEAGWVLSDSGLLEPPPIDYADGYGPEDEAAYFTFVNNSGYNLDLTVTIENPEGQAQESSEFNKGEELQLITPLGDESSFAFVLSQPGSATTYSFAGDRGGAPCQNRLTEISPGSSWRVEFVPTDGGTFGFPGILTSHDGVECTFGMLTKIQSAIVEHPVLAGVILVVAAAVIVVTGFRIAKAVRARAVARNGRIIAEAARIRRFAPEVLAIDAETVATERAVLGNLQREGAALQEEFWTSQRNALIREWGFEEEELSEIGSVEQYVRKYSSEVGTLEKQLAERFKLRATMMIKENSSEAVGEVFVRFSNRRAEALKQLGIIKNEYLTIEQQTNVYEAFLNQRRLRSFARRYAEADGALYSRVIESGVGDQMTFTALTDPTFNVTRWEEMYLAGRELLKEGAVIGG